MLNIFNREIEDITFGIPPEVVELTNEEEIDNNNLGTLDVLVINNTVWKVEVISEDDESGLYPLCKK